MGSTKGPKERSPWAEPIVNHVEPLEEWPDNYIGGVDLSSKDLIEAKPFEELIGAKLVRVYSVPTIAPGYESIRFCFDNGRSIVLQCRPVPPSQPDPSILIEKRDWELITAAKDKEEKPVSKNPVSKNPYHDAIDTINEAGLQR